MLGRKLTDDRKDFKSGGHLLYTPWLEEDSEQMTSGSGAWQRNRQAYRERRRGKNITGKGNSISKDPQVWYLGTERKLAEPGNRA